MKNIVEIDGVSRAFGTVKAVSDLTLSLCKGEIMGFLGTNGAGKTTTIKMLLARVDLADAANRPLRTYSKGMLQCAGIARRCWPTPTC